MNHSQSHTEEPPKGGFSLFSIPIASFSNFITEEERVELFKTIKGFKHEPHDAIIGDGGSTHLKGINFLDVKIKKRIQIAIDKYIDECGWAPSQIDEIWTNIQNTGSILGEHSHPNCVVSGSLYINAKDEIYFHNPNPYIYYTQIKKFTDYSCEWYKIPVENCQLIIFPSWLRHGKNNVANTMDDRVVISFNASPYQAWAAAKTF